MDCKKIFKGYGDWRGIQRDFFLDELPRYDGEYMYRSRQPDAKAGTVVLFRYKGKIVASAVSKRVDAFKRPTDDGNDGKDYKRGYRGTLYLTRKSIKIFDPVGADKIREFWPKFKRFAQAMQRLPGTPYPAFDAALTHVRFPKA
jgi:hypothetical protein